MTSSPEACFDAGRSTLCVLNTDNVPFNGDAIRSYVCSCDFTQGVERRFSKVLRLPKPCRLADFEAWLKDEVGIQDILGPFKSF